MTTKSQERPSFQGGRPTNQAGCQPIHPLQSYHLGWVGVPIFTPPPNPLDLVGDHLTAFAVSTSLHTRQPPSVWPPCTKLDPPRQPYSQPFTLAYFPTYKYTHTLTHTLTPPNIPSILAPPNPLMSVTPVDRWYICMKMSVGHCPIVNCQSPFYNARPRISQRMVAPLPGEGWTQVAASTEPYFWMLYRFSWDWRASVTWPTGSIINCSLFSSPSSFQLIGVLFHLIPGNIFIDMRKACQIC